MIADFLLRAIVAGIGVALAAGPLGCLILWRRMAYFGDATAHSALLGVALALALSIPLQLGVLAVAATVAVVVARFTAVDRSADALLGVFAHGTLALGLVLVALVPSARVDVEALLLGDILAVGAGDLVVIWAGTALVLATLAWRWSALLTATLDADLAAAAGIDADRTRLWLNLALAVVVAVGLKVVGALLISAMLILPAAAVRPLARGPEAMAALAALAGVLAVLGGVALSWSLDAPMAPAIVTVALVQFLVVALVRRA